MSRELIRNVAIIAHVDHGKTTLVDRMLYQSGEFRSEDLDKLAGGVLGLIMDSNPLERERGITILSKNCAINYQGIDKKEYKINIIDTPGHADFGGEVERVLAMANGVIVLVDAYDGPMPQTRFVLGKALEKGLKPIIVINKIDRPDGRGHEVVDEMLDLLLDLGADEEALDYPFIFASARDGWASTKLGTKTESLRDIFEAIVDFVPPPEANPDEPLRMLVTTIDYSEFVGRIAIGRVVSGKISRGEDIMLMRRTGGEKKGRITQVHAFEGLGRKEVESVEAGEICAVVGIEDVDIGDTISSFENPGALPTISVDEPTLDMTFRVNDSPFAGREGQYVTTRQVKERLERELQLNVALRVEPGVTTDEFRVSGRGLMHLGILLENMRREGYELAAGRPHVIFKEIDGKKHEPVERLVVDCPLSAQNAVMSILGERRAEVIKMEARTGAEPFVHMLFKITARALIGLRGRLLTATQGEAIMHHTFDCYEPVAGELPRRQNGVMVATHTGTVTSFALDALFDRGVFFVRPGDEVYAGQIVGETGGDKDIDLNVVKTKQLNNIRAAGKDDASRQRPVKDRSLEQALEYIQDDELVEVTPKSIRLRKRELDLGARRRALRAAGKARS